MFKRNTLIIIILSLFFISYANSENEVFIKFKIDNDIITNVDLERRSGLFLNIGLCVSLLLVITAFEWRFYDRGAGMDLGTIEDDFEDDEVDLMLIDQDLI